MTEREKYEGIYSAGGTFSRYGHYNHGRDAMPFISTWRFATLLDVGCGHNEFVTQLRAKQPCVTRALGVDFACPSADVRAEADALPFFDKQWHVLTSFDMLEHLLPEQVPAVLREFARVSSAFVFHIAHAPSSWKWKGEGLHPTVQPEAWWIQQIKAAGAKNVGKVGAYVVGSWDEKGDDIRVPSPPVTMGRSVILVGNGPALLGKGKGAVIDSFDEVVRFNSFRIAGYEEDCGSKVTLWSTFGRGTLPHGNVRPTRAIFIHGHNGNPACQVDEIWRIPLAFHAEISERVRLASDLPVERRSKLTASSGLLVACWLLERMGVQHLTLAGFSHFTKQESSRHHYYDPRKFGRPVEHDGDAEQRLFAAMEEDGKVAYLS